MVQKSVDCRSSLSRNTSGVNVIMIDLADWPSPRGMAVVYCPGARRGHEFFLKGLSCLAADGGIVIVCLKDSPSCDAYSQEAPHRSPTDNAIEHGSSLSNCIFVDGDAG